MAEAEALRQLTELLMSAFDADSAFRFVHLRSGGEEVVRTLNPDWAHDRLCYEIVQTLDQRGEIDEQLFRDLIRARRQREAEIEAVARLFLAPGALSAAEREPRPGAPRSGIEAGDAGPPIPAPHVRTASAWLAGRRRIVLLAVGAAGLGAVGLSLWFATRPAHDVTERPDHPPPPHRDPEISTSAGGPAPSPPPPRTTGDPRCVDDEDCGTLVCSNGQCREPPPADAAFAVAVATGLVHSCAVMKTGKLRCWGSQTWHQLGYPDSSAGQADRTACSASPATLGDVALGDIAAGRQVVQVAAGGGDLAGDGRSHTCAVLADGKLYCWGRGSVVTDRGVDAGWLGYGDRKDVDVPGQPLAFEAVKKVAVGDLFTCAVLGGRDDGKVACWGDSAKYLGYSPTPLTNDIGDEKHEIERLSRVRFPGGPAKSIDISVNEEGACVARDDGSTWCWGANAYGQLGTGRCGEPAGVTERAVLGAVKTVAVGRYHACALRDDHSVYCWGSNDDRQVGVAETPAPTSDAGCAGVTDAVPTPVQALPAADGDDAVVQLVAGHKHNCVRTRGGTVRCWGLASGGRLGVGPSSLGASSQALDVELEDNKARHIASYGNHTCAALESGAVWCWGSNDYGQITSGTCPDRNPALFPTAVEL